MKFKKEVLLRARISFLMLTLGMLIIIAKISYTQFAQGEYWCKLAQTAQLEYQSIPATRGNIYADEGSLLATSLPVYRVAMDPTIVAKEVLEQRIDELANLLARFYYPTANEQEKIVFAKKYKDRIENARTINKKYIVLNQKKINYEEQERMKKWPIFNLGRGYGGVIFEKQEIRHKPFAELAERTIGYVQPQYGVGIEEAFNKELQGTDGRALFQKVVGGNWKEVVSENKIMPVHGYDIETTIDINLQDIAQSSLLKALQNSNAKYGCAIVMEVTTGFIKAITNLSRQGNSYRETYNHAIGGAIEPGSVFKLVTMLALIEEKDTNLTDVIDTYHGEYQFHNRILRDVSAKRGGCGKITIQEVFEKSSNVGIARLIDEAFGKQPQKFINYIYHLGLGKRMGIQLAGEANPYITTPKSKLWNGISLPWMAIGYNTQITPLQMLCIYNAIANQGKLVQPIIVKNIKHANEVIKEFQPTILNEKICSEKTLKKLKIMLEGSVERGNSRRIRHGFYKMAGKTGTTNILANGKYSNDTSTSFIGYFPADKPQYSCVVVINSPQGASYHFGSQVAAPVFKDIVDRIAGKDIIVNPSIQEQALKIFKKNNCPYVPAGNGKELTYLCQQLNIAQPTTKISTWTHPQIKNNQLVWHPYNNTDCHHVPNVIGMQLNDALFLLENQKLQVITKGPLHGYIHKQSLPPYSKLQLAEDHTITIHLK